MDINISNWVKSLRLRAGWKHDKLAEELSMTKRSLSAFEKGKTVTSINIMVKISRIWNITLSSYETKSFCKDSAVIINK